MKFRPLAVEPPETHSLVGSPLGGLQESFPEGYFASVMTPMKLGNIKYRKTEKYRATVAAWRKRQAIARARLQDAPGKSPAVSRPDCQPAP